MLAIVRRDIAKPAPALFLGTMNGRPGRRDSMITITLSATPIAAAVMASAIDG
jgi:hypothetical protein